VVLVQLFYRVLDHGRALLFLVKTNNKGETTVGACILRAALPLLHRTRTMYTTPAPPASARTPAWRTRAPCAHLQHAGHHDAGGQLVAVDGVVPCQLARDHGHDAVLAQRLQDSQGEEGGAVFGNSAPRRARSGCVSGARVCGSTSESVRCHAHAVALKLKRTSGVRVLSIIKVLTPSEPVLSTFSATGALAIVGQVLVHMSSIRSIHSHRVLETRKATPPPSPHPC